MPYITSARHFLALSPSPYETDAQCSPSSVHHPVPPLSPSMSLSSASSSSSSSRGPASPSLPLRTCSTDPLTFLSSPFFSTPEPRAKSVVRPSRSSTPRGDLHALPERPAGAGVWGRGRAGEGEKGWDYLVRKLGREESEPPARRLSPNKSAPIQASAPPLLRKSPTMSSLFMNEWLSSTSDAMELPGRALGLLLEEFLFRSGLRG